jgi:hypothetical protein
MVFNASGYSPFQHEPLDHTRRSIRLLKILPDFSNTGLIQCSLWHATADTDTQYRCLSYMWGADQSLQEILVNGRSFRIQKNLWDFLGVARTTYATSKNTFWIDAVCIDQSSTSTAEKNHQVAQMDVIYSKAEEVIAWLGFSQGMRRAFGFWKEMNVRKPRTFVEARAIWNDHLNQNKTLEEDWNELAKSPYWKRAWITQEILLAQKLKLLVHSTELEIMPLQAMTFLNPERYRWHTDGTKQVYSATRVFYTYLQALCGSSKIKGSSLISLFHALPARESTKPRDRIYSLLALASDAASIPVNYESSDEAVLFHLLDVFRKSMCLCLISYLANALELQIGHGLTDASGRTMPLFAIPMRLASAWPLLGVELGEHPNRGVCSVCQQVVLMEEYGEHLLCTYDFSGCMRRAHLYLTRHKTGDDESYIIRANRSQEGLLVSHVETTEDQGFCSYAELPLIPYDLTVSLTAGVLITLLRQQAQDLRANDVLQLCRNARDCTGPLADYRISEIKRLPKECCSNKQCWNRDPSKRIEVPRCDPSEPWVPWEIRNPLSYSVTMGPVFLSIPGERSHGRSDTHTLLSTRIGFSRRRKKVASAFAVLSERLLCCGRSESRVAMDCVEAPRRFFLTSEPQYSSSYRESSITSMRCWSRSSSASSTFN